MNKQNRNNNEWLVSGSSDSSFIIWKIIEEKNQPPSLKQIVLKERAHSGPITCISILPVDNMQGNLKIATAGEDSLIKIWSYGLANKIQNAPSERVITDLQQIDEEKRLYHGQGSQKHYSINTIVFFKEPLNESMAFVDRLASGSEDGTIVIWDTRKWIQKQVIHTNLSIINSIAVANDGKFLVAGSSEEILICVFKKGMENINRKSEWKEWRRIDTGAACVSFSQDNRYIVYGDRIIQVASTETGQVVKTIEGNSQVNSVCFSPKDQNSIAAGSYDNSLKIYQIDIPQQIKETDGHPSDIYSLAISKNWRYIASGGAEGSIKVWDLVTGDLKVQMKGKHTQAVQSLIFGTYAESLDEEEEEEYDDDEQYEYLDMQDYIINNKPVQEKQLQQQSEKASNYNEFLISAGGCLIKVWDLKNGEKLKTLYGHQEGINAMALNPVKLLQMATAGQDNKILFWDLNSLYSDIEENQLTRKNSQYKSHNFQNLEYNLPTITQSVSLIDQEKHVSKRRGIQPSTAIKFRQSAFRQDSVIQSSKKSDQWFTIETFSCVNCLTFCKEGEFLISGCEDRVIRIYHVNYKQREVELFQVFDENFLQMESSYQFQSKRQYIHSGPILCIAISPDNKRIASAGCDKNIKIWTMEEEGKLIKDISAKNGDIKSIQYLPKINRITVQNKFKYIRYIASGGSNFQIKIWNEETGELYNILHGHSGTIQSLMFSSNGLYLVSASKTIKIWKKYNNEYLLEKNISKTQAFQCRGIIPPHYSNQDKYIVANSSYQDKLNIELLDQQHYL